MTYPTWATPERRAELVKLWAKYGNRCLKGHLNCPDLSHYRHEVNKAIVVGKAVQAPIYDRGGNDTGKRYPSFTHRKVVDTHTEWVGGIYFIEEDGAIADWKADDRARSSDLWKLERRRMHVLYPHIHKRGQFDAIARDEYLAKRAVFEIVGIGISAFTFKRIAEVHIPSLKATLWVDLTGIEVDKSKSSRKLARFNRGAVPKQIEDRMVKRCRKAVERYLENPQS